MVTATPGLTLCINFEIVRVPDRGAVQLREHVTGAQAAADDVVVGEDLALAREHGPGAEHHRALVMEVRLDLDYSGNGGRRSDRRNGGA
jgi:hypothetical protein